MRPVTPKLFGPVNGSSPAPEGAGRTAAARRARARSDRGKGAAVRRVKGIPGSRR